MTVDERPPEFGDDGVRNMIWEDLWKDEQKAERNAPPAPVVPIDSAQGHKYALRALESEAAIVASAPEGTRNDALNKAAFRMGKHVGAGTVDARTVRGTLANAGRAAGLPDSEISLVLRDSPDAALDRGQAFPRHPPRTEDLPAVTIFVEPDAEIVEEFWHARPILTHLRDFARARTVAPWAVLGCALARVICATPPNIVLPPITGGPASLNLFVGLVGRSGSGKGSAERVAAEALDVGHIETRTTGSGEGTVHAYVKRTKDGLEQHTTAVLFTVPEVDTLGALGARNGSTLMPLLRSAYSGEQLGFQYADPTKSLLVAPHKYRLCLIVGIQPGRAGVLLDDADGGTPQRFSWLIATDPGAPDVTPKPPAPRVWRFWAYESNMAGGFHAMEVCATARDLIINERKTVLRGGGADALDGHRLLTRLKIAAGLALLDERLDVNEEDWQLAGIVSTKSDATRGSVVAEAQARAKEANAAKALAEGERASIVGDKVEEDAVKKLVRNIKNQLAQRDGSDLKSAVRRRVKSTLRQHFDDAVTVLVMAGDVVESEDDRGPVLKLASDAR